MAVPAIRVRSVNHAAVRDRGEFILYWMTAFRRTEWNFSLQRAVEWAERLGKPLVVLEALRAGHRWACDRFHRFVLDGMEANARRLAKGPATYLSYVERAPGEGAGLLEALARRACVVVTDDFPCFFLPRMVEAAGRRLDLLLEAVDGNGLLPLRAARAVHPTAYSFRRFLQKELLPHLAEMPLRDPLARRPLPRLESPPAPRRWKFGHDVDPATLPLDHSVGPAAIDGGTPPARRAMRDFLDRKLARYAGERNQPEEDVSSGLSPYLHWGHLSVHEVFTALAEREGWTPDRVSEKRNGRREGWWGMSPAAEAFLDQLVTWREVGFNFCSLRPDYDRYESLPLWARRTLEAHAEDRRDPLYPLELFEEAKTHDPLWNAAQNQLRREGRIHNYLRMLWGKKVLQWSRTPGDALATLIELNNKYALDGRNPNSYSGIFWVLGRYDRPWGPERPVFGTIRTMSSENTARKVRVRGYLRRYAP